MTPSRHSWLKDGWNVQIVGRASETEGLDLESFSRHLFQVSWAAEL